MSSKILIYIFVIGFSPIFLVAQSQPEEEKDWVEIPALADGLCVNNLFQSNMVIQRDVATKVWGWAPFGEKVTVTFGGQSISTKSDADGSWSVNLAAMPANSSPQKMKVIGKTKTLSFENILVGDIWLLGGQSNMELGLSRIEGGRLEMHSANFPAIRHITIPRNSIQDYQKSFPLTQKWDKSSKTHVRSSDYWEVCNPKNIGNLSGIGYVFARRIHMATQVPIGVIDTSVGGSTLESWTPYAAVKKIDKPETRRWVAEQEEYISGYNPNKELEERVQRKKAWLEKMKILGRTVRPVNSIIPTDLRPPKIKAGNLYGGMIAPLSGFALKGVIWHQGYNNCFEGTLGATRYFEIFPTMIESWRTAFSNPKMAFGIISLCTAGEQNPDNYLEQMIDVGANIREAQYKTFLNLRNSGDKNIGFASSYDLRRSWYHPGLKIPAAERIASWALNTQYGLDVRWEPPYLREMKVEKGKIILSFNVKGPLGTNPEGTIVGFAIAGEDGKFQPAQADFLVTGKDKNGKVRKDSSSLVLTSPLVSDPIHYRYAWARNPHANLVSAWDKLPFATQRSDAWTLSELYKSYTGKEPQNNIDQLEGNEKAELKLSLQKEDLRRRVFEAQAFLERNTVSN